MTERRAITLADVAAAAKVHPATVSRALSRPDLVRDETCARVEAAVERLGYVPNRAARQLAGGRTATLAILVPDIANPFFARIVQAAQRRATAADHLVVLADTAQSPAVELDSIRSLAPHVDGIVACSPVAQVGALRRAAGDRPLVFVNRRSAGGPSVVVDQDLVVTLAVEHLRALGHVRPVVVPGPAGYWSSRRRARQVACLGDVSTTGPAEPTFDGGRRALAAVVGSGATGVVAFNDVLALGLVAAATAAGIAVPGELSVVGSDDVPFAAMATPALTTVAAPLDELAATAIEVVLALVGGTAAPGPITIRPHLVVRDSTAPPR